MTVADYSAIKHRTEGKWRIWDPKRPPNEFIELAGGNQKQLERPDEWIRPSDSVVIAVKGASVHTSDRFRMGYTIRFPRFTGLKTDKKWEDALSIQGFLDLKSKADAEREQRKFEVDDSRRKRARTSRKKEITVAGAEDLKTPYAGKSSMVLEGLSFCIWFSNYTPNEC